MRVLAFGDSLTSGMTTRDQDYPPSAFFQKLMKFSTTVNQGLGGDRLEDFPRRLENALKDQKRLFRRKIDVVFLWGGTNDLRCGRGSEECFASLLQSLQVCRAEEVGRIVVINVPEMSCERDGNGNIGLNRIAFNLLVQQGSADGSYDVLDVAAAIPFWRGEDDEGSDEWFCDGLHFTRKGYKMVGKMMVKALKK